MARSGTLHLLLILLLVVILPQHTILGFTHHVSTGAPFARRSPYTIRLALDKRQHPLQHRTNGVATRTALSASLPSKLVSSGVSLFKRLDTLDSSGFTSALTSGFAARIKSLHNPKFYLGMAGLAAFRWGSLIRNYYFWILLAFLYKWYRARYVYKVPVWDRQPNWNNVITSKEQEKDLKAYTCKNCGSTIFIAKSREFFFEGGTGIGGLGCFSCGAKGADNFIMDRDRIVADVADVDDYFEYERPLDFVSSAERKRVLKEAGGDEDKANEIIMERANQEEAKKSNNNSDTPTATAATPLEPEAEDDDQSTPEVPPASEDDETASDSPTKATEDGLDALGMDDL